MKNRTYSILNNRYERAWNCMSKTGCDDTLYKFGPVRLGKSAAPDFEFLKKCHKRLKRRLATRSIATSQN